jgi:gliding motility-associated-like protein
MKINYLFIIILMGFWGNNYAQTADFNYTEVCFGDTTVLTNTSSSPEADPIISVTWDLDNDTEFDDASGNIIKHKFLTTGTKPIGMRIVTQGGESKTIYQDVQIGSYPTANFNFNNTCSNDFTEFTNTSTVEGEDLEDFIWSFGDGQTNDYETSPKHWYVSPGIYTVKLIAISNIGCTDTITKVVDVQPIPTFSIKYLGNTIFSEGESVEAYVEGEFDEISWSTGEKTDRITISTGGTYFAEIKKGGCPNSKSFTIVVKDREGVANIITPNGDGFNDTWKVFHISNHAPCSVSVFSRDGLEVFSSTNYNNDWGGTYNGKPLPEGTYYYVLSYKSGLIRKGAVNIIR